MKKQLKLLAAGLFLFTGILFMPTSEAQVQAATPRMNYTSLTLKQGKTKKLKVKGFKGKKIRWSSSNEKVVTVNKKGKISTLKGGKATVTAKAGKRYYRCKVYSVGLNTTKLTLSPGSSYTLKVKNGKNTKWSTSNKKVAKISSNGKVTAKKSGTATIICRTNNRTIKCKVYVPKLNATSLRLPVGQSYQISVLNTGEGCTWYSDNGAIVSVDQNGMATATGYNGTATITCKTGKAALTCTVKAVSPGNIVTPMNSLPMSSKGSRLSVTVESYPGTRTYTIYHQASAENKNSGKNGIYANYMPDHGCGACALSTVLSGYANMQMGPVYTTEVIEKRVFGSGWKANYKKGKKSMPVSLYGISRVLSSYNINNEYVRSYDPVGAYNQITEHLKTGNAVVVEVKKVGSDARWSNSKHTMVLLGVTDNGMVIVADSADRASYFGDQRRIKYTSLLSLLNYMFSCTDVTSTAPYYTKEASCGGYVLVNPQ